MQKSFKSITILLVTLSLQGVILPGFFTKVQASEVANRSQTTSRGSEIDRVTFDPPGDGEPDQTAGGASRGGGCPLNVGNLGNCVIPLMPASQQRLTVAERPTFFVYVPETAAKEIFFSLRDENSQTSYQTKIPLAGQSGIVSFKLPDDAPALEVGKNYQWAFILVGETGLRPDSPGVQGTIQRVELNPSVKTQLEQVTSLERAALYRKNGLWLETLATLAEARKLQPNDSSLAASWEDLLKSAGLEAIATRPLL